MLAEFQLHYLGAALIVIGVLVFMGCLASAPKEDPTLRPPSVKPETSVEPKPRRPRFLL